MGLLKFIDKKLPSNEQLNYLKGYLFFGAPLGIIFVEGFKYFFVPTYHFSIFNLISIIITDTLLASPLIINYFRHKNKYKKVVEKIRNNEKLDKVKALFDYNYFEKGKIYNLDTSYLEHGNKIYVTASSTNFRVGVCNLKDVINKFDLDDIREERLKKLKRLNKLWKK